MAPEGIERSQLARTVRYLRQQKGWSHQTLAERATKLMPVDQGLSAKTVGNIERDENSATVATLRAVAAALDVEVWQLFVAPPVDLAVAREAAIEIMRRGADDQKTLLAVVRRFPAVESPETRDGIFENPIPAGRRAAGD